MVAFSHSGHISASGNAPLKRHTTVSVMAQPVNDSL